MVKWILDLFSSNFFSSIIKLFYYSSLQVQFIEAITQLLKVLSIFITHDFSFTACQHNLCSRQITLPNTMSKKAMRCQVVNTFMPKKVYLVFSFKQM